MCTVNRLFKHIIPNDDTVTCCRTLRMPICYKAAATGQSLIDGPLSEWFTCLLFVLLLDFCSSTGLVSMDKIPQVITRFYLSPHSPPAFEVVLTRYGSLISPYVPLGINQALPYGCSFVTYGHPEGLQQVTVPSFGMMCLNSQLTVHICS